MGSVNKGVMAGLTEAVEDVNVEKKALQRQTITIVPVKDYKIRQTVIRRCLRRL